MALAAALIGTALMASCSGGATSTADPEPTSAAPIVHATEVPRLHPSVDGFETTNLRIDTVAGSAHELAVLVARTELDQQHGLMEVPTLPDGIGMWFLFDQDRSTGFWMFQTLVPLSIAYIDADGVIVDILGMEPCPPEAGRDCPGYPPSAAYRTTLEVAQGWFEEQGITVGDRVSEVGA